MVVIDNLDIEGVTPAPDEAQPKLNVDAYAVLPDTVTTQCLQSIPAREAQVVKRRRGVQVVELSEGNFFDRLEADATARGKQSGGVLALE